MLIAALVQDRLMAAANSWIDLQSVGALQWVKSVLVWSNDHSLGIVGLFLIASLVTLMIAALVEYADTSPELEAAREISKITDELRRERGKQVAVHMLNDIKREAGIPDLDTGSTSHEPSVSSLTFVFPDETSCSEFIEEAAKIGSEKVDRRLFWVDVVNESDQNVRNVRAYLFSVRELSIHGVEEPHPVLGSKIFHLKFSGRSDVLDFSPHMCARLYLVSYAKNFLPGFIRIEGENKEVMHQGKAWKFSVRITADGFLPTEKSFAASVDNGLLRLSTL